MVKVLIVEDETSLLELYAEFLKSEGYDVIQAIDGEMGVEKAINEDWDIMFLDIMLPKLDGLEVLKKVKTQVDITKKPIVMLTNLDNPDVVKECISEGAKEYLSKADIIPQTIAGTVRKYVSKE